MTEFDRRFMAASQEFSTLISERFGYSGAALFFLCGLVSSMITATCDADGIDLDELPQEFKELYRALHAMGEILGPLVAEIEGGHSHDDQLGGSIH